MNQEAVTITLFSIAAASLICTLILWRLLTAQNNKAQAAYSSHRHEHKQVLAKSKAERRELKLLLNAFDDALVITTPSGIIQVANESAKQLSNGRKLRRRSITTAFIDKKVCETITELIDKNEATKKKILLTNSSFGTSSNKKNGDTSVKRNTLEDSAWIIDYAPLPYNEPSGDSAIDPTNTTPLHRIILRNITVEHRTDQIKREFVANASHELRTPLAIISGYLENLLDDDVVESPVTSRRFLTTIRKHSDRISKLIDEMLTISKLESGESAQLNLAEFNICETIKDIIARLDPMSTAQQASINTHYPDLDFTEPEIILIGDQFYWDQALFNIIENALKQNAPTDGEADTPIQIDITIKREGNNLTINITDNGKGIPAAHLPYIFNRFYRVQKHHSQNQVKGTGLGLSIVKHAIEAHGGTITATSQPGITTTFKITCPT